MGVPESSGRKATLAMKILLLVGFLAALAVAEPVAEPNAEANADPWYRSYGYGLGHYGGYRGYGYSAYRPYYGGYGYLGRKKRDAEPVAEPVADPNAEANADPWYSAYGYGLGHYGGYRHLGYSAYRPYYGGYGYWGRKKRSADAEPEPAANAEADADPWYSAYGYGLGHYMDTDILDIQHTGHTMEDME